MSSASDCDWIELTDRPLDVAKANQFICDPAAGGSAIFIGTTRAESNPVGSRLIALDYEAYAAMALQQMKELARKTRAKWPVIRLAILHRNGRVALAEPSVVIAVSCPHRGEALDACRWLIDTLKPMSRSGKRKCGRTAAEDGLVRIIRMIISILNLKFWSEHNLQLPRPTNSL